MANYKIVSGDTLNQIAQKQGTTVSALMAANPQIKNPNLIYAGQSLNIPTALVSTTPPTSTPSVGATMGGQALSNFQSGAWTATQYNQWAAQQTARTTAGTPTTPTQNYDTGNEDLNNILTGIQDVLKSIIDSGKIVNPVVNITPELTKKWLDQAETELSPYYQSQFKAIKSDLQTDLGYLSDQYKQVVESNEATFKQNLATQREAEAGAGTIFSGGRRTREEGLAESAQRSMAGLGTTMGYQAQKAGTAAERTIGSAGLGGLNLSSYAPYSVSTLGEGQYTPLGERQLFAPAGGIVGSLEREQIEKKRAYQDLLKYNWLSEKTV